ncbi:MAG TPA: calcium-translocating P-type ATPase, PMCA-type [Chitinophagaceae bacterium]|nr:calcium-translocating P-type ATPase, PMCA-type [Chitinophagaceae bacterium]
MNWHNIDINKVFALTGSSPSGLSSQSVEQRIFEYGLNELAEKKKKPVWLLFVKQFNDFMILLLIVAAIISGLIGDVGDTVVILVIVLLNALIGFVQEYRAGKAMDELKKLSTPHVEVLRNGAPVMLSSVNLVPGDIVLLEAGTLLPADLRLFETNSLFIDESSLTGESVPVNKTSETLVENDLPIGDRFNMAYKGTLITNGRGTGIVVATGMTTEIGQIARMLQTEEAVTPLQKRMADFGRKLSYLVLIICAVLFVTGLLRGEPAIKMLLVAISLAVAAIPEALPALITIALARGAKRLVKKNVLIRKLRAVETLGSVTFICSDKTGTLTQNKMKVVEVVPYPDTLDLRNGLSLLESSMALNQNVMRTIDGAWLGDPTEVALIEYIQQKYSDGRVEEISNLYHRVAELPFDSDRKTMTTIHKYGDKYLVIAKGAVEAITSILRTDDLNGRILQEASVLAANGIRVLAYGYRVLEKIPTPFSYPEIEKDLVFAGLAGMIDPPREEVKIAIKECKTAGIQAVMITGDHPETAAAIAREIGILDSGGLMVTGRELSKLTEEDLDMKVERVRVYARLSPEQKLNIVKSLQRKKHFVAMTGDGVNDAPSLKAANIGIAMGINGTDVTKEAAHMILLDDNFATIIKAVKEGRRIYDNIRKFVKYIMTCNSAEIWTIFLAPLIGLPIPLLPIHILWINLVTDGLPGLALAAEKTEKDVMQRPPRSTNESLFAHGMAYHIAWVGLLMAAVTLGTQALATYYHNDHWQTMVFTVLSLAQLGHVMAIRSEKEFLLKQGLFSNPQLLVIVFLTFLLQVSVIYLPFANKILKTTPLSLNELLHCIVVSAIVFHAVELEKLIKKKLNLRSIRAN